MSFLAQVPEGLKAQECERGSGLNPPLPYIPERTDDDDKRKATTIKFVLANGVETRSDVWDGVGTKEQFLCHTRKIWEALEGVGLLKKQQEAEEKVRESKSTLKDAKNARELTRENLEAAILEVEKVRLREELALLEKSVTDSKALVETTKGELGTVGRAIFSTAATFMSGEGKAPWDKIVQEQAERDPWVDLRGREHEGLRGYTRAAFDDCMVHFLKTVFANNAAEDQKFYMTCLRKPSRVKVRAFLQRCGKLNSYVKDLPCSFDSRDATDATKRVTPHDDAEFAFNMLHAMPKAWKQQYYLGHKAPVSVEYLQDALEKIEVAFPQDHSGGNRNIVQVKNKMTSMSDKIPKSKSQRVKFEKAQRVRTPKHCALCQKFGGAHTTHNSQECRKWDKVGNLKKDFKNQSKVIREAPPGARLNYAQLYNENVKLKASRNRAKKALKKASKKRKHTKVESSDSDYDSDST